MSEYSDQLQIGDAQFHYSPAMVTNDQGYKVVDLVNIYTPADPPDPSLSDFCWSWSGKYLGFTQDSIQVQGKGKTTQYYAVGINAIHETILEEQSIEITINLTLNNNIDVQNLATILPIQAVNQYYVEFGGLQPSDGSLCMIINNRKSSDQFDKYTCEVWKFHRVRIEPGQLTLNGGHTPKQIKFTCLAGFGTGGRLLPPPNLGLKYYIDYRMPQVCTTNNGVPLAHL